MKEFMGEIRSELRIWNPKQMDFYRSCNCEMLRIDTGYSEKVGKICVYIDFQIDDNLRKSHDIWMKNNR